jgi:hypothetical protein
MMTMLAQQLHLGPALHATPSQSALLYAPRCRCLTPSLRVQLSLGSVCGQGEITPKLWAYQVEGEAQVQHGPGHGGMWRGGEGGASRAE